MIEIPHLLIGAVLGSRIHNFWILFILANILHVIFDYLPHYEYDNEINLEEVSRKKFFIFSAKAAADFAGGILLVWLLTKNSPYFHYIIFGTFSSIFADGLTFLYFFIKHVFAFKSELLGKIYLFHQSIHIAKNKNPLVWGIITTGAVVILSLFLLLNIF